MRYAKLVDGTIQKFYPQQPEWFHADGTRCDDAFLLESGVYPVIEEHGGDELNYIVKDQSEWIYGETQIEATYYQYLEDYPECNLITHKYVLNDESAWVTDETAATITKTYSVAENSAQEMSDFVSSKPVYWPDGFTYDETAYVEKPMEQWIYDDINSQVIKTAWEILKDPTAVDKSDIFYYQEQATFDEWTLTDTTATEKTYVYERDLGDIKERLAAAAADIRYQIEVGGIVIGTDGFDTSRESQSKFSSLYQLIVSGDKTDDVSWKTNDGFKSFTVGDFKQICLAVFAFVETAYANEQAFVEYFSAITEFDSLVPVLDEIYTRLGVDGSIFIDTLG